MIDEREVDSKNMCVTISAYIRKENKMFVTDIRKNGKLIKTVNTPESQIREKRDSLLWRREDGCYDFDDFVQTVGDATKRKNLYIEDLDGKNKKGLHNRHAIK